MEREYPTQCRYCGQDVCKCPPILQDTLGRIAQDAPSDSDGRFGSVFLSERADEYMRFGTYTVEVNEKALDVTPELLSEISQTSRAMLGRLSKIEHGQIGLHFQLFSALSRVDQLAFNQRMTQDSLDEVLRVLRAMPSEERSAVLGFLGNIGAGAWLQAILAVGSTVAS